MLKRRKQRYSLALALFGVAVQVISPGRWFGYALLVIAAALLAWDLVEYHGRKQRQAKPFLALDEERSPADKGPHLVAVRVGVDARSLIAVGASAPHAFVYCAIVLFRNDPSGSHPNAEATSVFGEITFVQHGRPVLSVGTARWGDTDQPAVRKAAQPFASLIDLNAVPFRIGETHELDIAIKHPDQPHFYAFDNSTYDHPNWENPAFRLDGDLYEVVVRLRGAHLDQEHRFRLRNLGTGKGLELSQN
jgi:hypothetical protein